MKKTYKVWLRIDEDPPVLFMGEFDNDLSALTWATERYRIITGRYPTERKIETDD